VRYEAATEFRIGALTPAWEQLAERIGAAPFLRPGWVTAWWRAFGHGALELLVVRRDAQLVGVLPLQRRRGGLYSPSNDHTPVFGPLSDGPQTAAALADALCACRPSQFMLGCLPAGVDGLDACVTAARASGYRTLTRTLWRSPYLDIDGGLAAYEAARRRSVLHDLGRRRRRLCEEGTVTIEVADGGARLDTLLGQAFELEAKGWKGARGTAMASRAETRCFYSEVAAWAAARGWLRLSFLRLDGRPLAVDYALEHAGVQYLLKGGYDPGFARFAPGQQLLHETIRRGFALGLRRIEFGGADEVYKRAWTDSTRGREEVRAFAPSPRGRLAWIAHARLRPLARRAHVADAIRGAKTRLP
jgi:CelD/BcsL family acetyltransferase involved in cellulose biosynthesis